MLTKQDVDQIRSVVREEVNVQVEPVTKELERFRKETQRNFKTIGTEVKFIRKALNGTIDALDRNQVADNKRFEKIEVHVGLNQA